MAEQAFSVDNANLRKKKAAAVSVFSNSVLVISKFVIGIVTGSVSIISEAAHSSVDLIASLIAYYAVKTAGIPADAKHPYGHGKVENISGAVEAVLIVVAALWIIYEAVQKLFVETLPEKLEFGIVIMLVSIAANVLVSRYLLKIAKETQSHALEADALHLQADVWTSIGVLGGLVAIKLTGIYWFDPVIAIAMAFIIFKAGYSMTKKSVAELMDVTMSEEDNSEIVAIIEAHSMVRGYTNLRTRRSGSAYLVDVNLVLDKELPLDKAHSVCDEIEESIITRFAGAEVLIHVEPN